MTSLFFRSFVSICTSGFSFIAIIFFSFTAFIYPQDITGDIEGQTTDSKGNPIARVNISVLSSNLMGTRGTATNDDGYFHIISLPVGTYNVKISAVGFSKVNIEEVQVQLGKTNNLGVIVLKQQAVDLPEISVSGKKPVIDPVSTTSGGNINSSYFETLPIRSYKSMAIVLPQVNGDYFGGNISFAGATRLGTKYFVDGIEVNDPLFAFKATDLPYNFIKEVEVKTGGYAVNTRSSLGGLVNVITNSGSNEFHGSIFGFYTSNRLADNSKYSSMGQGDFSNYDAGFGLGGPVIIDKLWFYAAYNPTFNLRDVEIPDLGIYVYKTLTHKFAFKLNWRALNKLNVNFTVTGDPIHTDQVQSTQDSYANPDPLLNVITEGSVNYSLNSTYTINNNIFLQGLIARVDRYALTLPATDRSRNDIYFYDTPTDTYSGGNGQRIWDAFRRITYGKISATFQWEQHILNAGVDYKLNSNTINADFYGLVRKNDTLYVEYPTKWIGEVQSRIPSVFIQDNWRILNRLTLTTGLRWETQSVIDANGEEVLTVSVPLQPHIGVVFLINEKNRQRIFASFRRFSHEYTPNSGVLNIGYQQEIHYDHDPRIDNTGGVIVTNLQHPLKPEQKEIRGQFYDEFSLGYERLLGWNIKVSVQGVYRRLGEAIEDIYYPSEDRTEVGNPGRGILSDAPRAQHDYKALVFSIERTSDIRFNFLASYVLSRNYGNYGGLADFGSSNSSQLFNNPALTWVNSTGLLSNDRPHVFKFSGYYIFHFGLTSGISFIAQSGTPISEYAGTGIYGIKFLEPRGSIGRTPATWDLNARFTYILNFIPNWNSKLILDIFHIGSPQKVISIDEARFDYTNESHPNSSYGKVTSYQPSMSVRLGIEVSF